MKKLDPLAKSTLCAVAALFLAFGMRTFAQGNGQAAAQAIFNALDTNHDGTISQREINEGFSKWFQQWSANGTTITNAEITSGFSKIVPGPPPVKPGQVNTFNPQGNSTPLTAPKTSVDAMMAALPTTAGVTPQKPRKILVLAHTGAGGFVHASIPLTAATVEALGNKGNLWTTTVTYNAADINTDNLRQYDAIFLASTTACFLDDPDPAVTAARRAAFLAFVRSGKGIAGVHAASDAYHTDCKAAEDNIAKNSPGMNFMAMILAARFTAYAGKNADSLTKDQWTEIGDDWFNKLDTAKAGKISRADFVSHFNSLLPAPGNHIGGGEAKPVLQWPEYNKLIGGFFKFHWPDPQEIYVKIDDPNSPLTAMFHDKEFVIHDETYTFNQESFSRKNVHVLTSIDYAKMSAEDKAKEANPRTDADYALSYIRKEGEGRVFYEGHGHADRVYAMTPMLEHLRAGIQYVLGDLKADDSPSEK